MPVTVVVGGQYGSEAKAKAVVQQAKSAAQPMGIRCGGPNAGHTVYFGDQKYVLRLVPSVVAVPGAELIICAGAMVDIGLLNKEITEIEAMGVPVRNRLTVDRNCVVVDAEAVIAEREAGLGAGIGSTQTGTGSTAAARAMRTAKKLGDMNTSHLDFSVGDTFHAIHEAIDWGNDVIVEGTQGFGLSLYHSGHYPFCTSKDTTVSAFLAEAGIAPGDVTNVIMVIRTYPIRVGGNSGPMKDEISWAEVQTRCGAPEPLIEMTSVTKKIRRVGEFDYNLVDRAVKANKPTQIAVHGLDYLEWKDRGVRSNNSLSYRSKTFLHDMERFCGVRVTMAFTGPHQDDMVLRGGTWS